MADILSGLRVLVVEDEMMVLFMIEDILADLGCTAVTSAAAVDEALARIETQTFDVAMLDSNLGGTRSDAVAAALDARGVQQFDATGYGDLGAKEGYRNRHVLQKPFQREDVEASFRHVLSVVREQ